MRHVDADLMRAAGLEPAADVRVAAIARDDLPVRDRAARALLRDGHFLAVGRVPADGRVNGARIFAHAAAHDGLVYARQAAVGKLSRQRQVRKVVFRDYQQPRRVLVDAVHDAGALLAADAGQRVAAAEHQRVYERAVRVAGGRVDDHAARLVDDQQIVVLVHDVDGDILRPQLAVGCLGHDKAYLVAGRALVVFPDRASADGHCAVLDQPRGGAARKLRHTARKESVDTFGALLCCYRYDVIVQIIHYRSLNSARISSMLKSSPASAADFGFASGAFSAGFGAAVRCAGPKSSQKASCVGGSLLSSGLSG